MLGDGPNSIFHDGGTAIMINAKEDDYKPIRPGTPAHESPAALFTDRRSESYE